MAKQISEIAAIYFETTKKVVRIIAVAQRGFSTVEVGETIDFEESDITSARFSEVLVEILNSYRVNTYSEDVARALPGNEGRTFIKQHLKITVERFSDGSLSFLPMHHERGGYTGSFSERVCVSSAEVPTGIPAALRVALSKAT
jgi:hypothetical protein